MFDPATRKKVDKVIEQEKKRVDWESKFPGHDPGGPDSSTIAGGVAWIDFRK